MYFFSTFSFIMAQKLPVVKVQGFDRMLAEPQGDQNSTNSKLVNQLLQNLIPDAELDCIGLYCPMPMAMTKMEMDKLKTGQVLMVEADDLASEKDITGWADKVGHEVVSLEREDTILIFHIRKGGS